MEALRNLSSTIHEQARHFYRKMITLDKDNVFITIVLYTVDYETHSSNREKL